MTIVNQKRSLKKTVPNKGYRNLTQGGREAWASVDRMLSIMAYHPYII